MRKTKVPHLTLNQSLKRIKELINQGYDVRLIKYSDGWGVYKRKK